jgi:Ca2+-binding RTX toxin-like protein
LFACVLLAVVLLPASPTAQAGANPTTVEVLPDGRTLSIDAGKARDGEDNHIGVTYFRGTFQQDPYVQVRVTANGRPAEIEAGNGCTHSASQPYVYCANPDDQLKRIVFRGHKGDDAFGIGGGSNPTFLPPPGVKAFLFGGRGHDTFVADDVRAVIKGGPGRDAAGTGGDSDRFAGGRGADTGGGRDRLLGGPRDDELLGREGKDLIEGGPGRDRLAGGRGRDELHAKDERRDETIDCGKGDDPAATFDRGLDPEPRRC